MDSRVVLKEKNENLLVGIGTGQQKVTTPIVPKQLQRENGQESFRSLDESHLLYKENHSTDEISSPEELNVNKTNSPPSPLPDIVNVVPTITVNESPSNQNFKEGQITSNISNGSEQFYKKIIPSGPSSSISSDDELFVECETYSLTDKTTQLLSSKQNDKNFPINQNKENEQSKCETNINESNSNIKDNSNWKNVLTSLSSENIENLENSKIDFDISPQNLNMCLNNTFDNNVQFADKNAIISNANVFQVESLSSDNIQDFVNQIINTPVKEIEKQNFELETDNNSLDITFENVAAKDDTIDNILCEQICKLHIESSSNSRNLTAVENQNSKSSESDFNKHLDMTTPIDNIEQAPNINHNETLNNMNLTTDIEMQELYEINSLASETKCQEELINNQEDEIKKSIPAVDESKVVENMELLSKMENSSMLNNTDVITTSSNELYLNDNFKNENHNLNVTVEDKTLLIRPRVDHGDLSHSINSEEHFNKTNISPLQGLPEPIVHGEELVPNDTKVIHEETFNFNETQDVFPQGDSEENIISSQIEVAKINNANSESNNVFNVDNLENITSSTAPNSTNDEKLNVDLNLTIDITEIVNDSKVTIPKKSPIILDTISETTTSVANIDKTISLPSIEKSKSINELNNGCDIESGRSSPNLNYVDSSSQGKLNTTFAASTEALNSTINVPVTKNSNFPILLSPVDLQKNLELHKNEENQNNDFKDDDFKSSGMILNQSDFDFLLTKGNTNNNIPVDRSSLLLKFDPFLGKPQIVQTQEFSQAHVQKQPKLNQELCPLTTSVTSSSHGRLCPTVEEEEYFDIGTSNSLTLNIDKEENLITTADTENSNISSDIKVVTIKTEPLDASNKMSIDVVRDMKTENNLISTDINSTDVKYDLKMEDLEKKIQNEVLKRTEEIGKKLKEVEQREESLLRRITEKDKTTAKMGSVIEAYEKAIAEMIAEKEEITHNYERQIAEIKSERDLNYQHLASLESTFADLHVKYERSKQITAKLKANEEDSCAARKQFLENLRLQEQRYEKMKNHAMQQLEIANNKLEFLTKNHSSEITKLKALLKKEEISKGSISEQLQQKTRENEELVKICDELINGQGS